MTRQPRHVEQLAALRERLVAVQRTALEGQPGAKAGGAATASSGGEFKAALHGVAPLPAPDRRLHSPPPVAPRARQRERDDQAALRESLSDEIDVDSLLDTDETLSYRRGGIGPDVLRRLRRGTWTIQDHLDLHGHRVDEARAALGEFLRDALQRGLRCVRIVHGKGLGSKDRSPVLKGKVRGWLVQRDAVIAFCQARPHDGGAGALIVLLRPAR